MKEIHDHPKLDDLHYQELMRFSPKFKKINKMTKSDLINTIAGRLYIKHGGIIREHAKIVALGNLNNIELSYWLYNLELRKAKP